MYCPGCFNDTLKLTSSGVVKMTFNGKAKATSQFFYNLSKESAEEIYEKMYTVVEDYFSWYSDFQNKDDIKSIALTSSDFKCSNGCSLGHNFSNSVLNLVVTKDEVIKAAKELGQKYQINLGPAFS
tara:strand:- start:911 stop:1288 length:378 start_codon:yes stop_codon:yes gene_type:complete